MNASNLAALAPRKDLALPLTSGQVTHAKLMLESRVPPPEEVGTTSPSSAAASPVVDRQMLILDSKEMEASEKQLEDRAGRAIAVQISVSEIVESHQEFHST